MRLILCPRIVVVHLAARLGGKKDKTLGEARFFGCAGRRGRGGRLIFSLWRRLVCLCLCQDRIEDLMVNQLEFGHLAAGERFVCAGPICRRRASFALGLNNGLDAFSRIHKQRCVVLFDQHEQVPPELVRRVVFNFADKSG